MLLRNLRKRSWMWSAIGMVGGAALIGGADSAFAWGRRADEIRSKIDLTVKDTIVQMKSDVGNIPGLRLEAVADDVPEDVSCVRQILPHTLDHGTVEIRPYSNDGKRTDYVRERNRINADKAKTCSVKYLLSFPEAKRNYYAYRDITAFLNLDKDVRVSFGSEFGLGAFGLVVSAMTVGLSDLAIDSANQIKTHLERSISNALSRKVPVQDIVTSLSLILCEIEAAHLAKMACENSRLVDQESHIKKVREHYTEFLATF